MKRIEKRITEKREGTTNQITYAITIEKKKMMVLEIANQMLEIANQMLEKYMK